MASERATLDFDFEPQAGVLLTFGGPPPWSFTASVFNADLDDWLPWAYVDNVVIDEVEFGSSSPNQGSGWMLASGGVVRDLPSCFTPAETCLEIVHRAETATHHAGWFVPAAGDIVCNFQERVALVDGRVWSLPVRP